MDEVAFETTITLEGPERHPRQMLAEQTYGGHASLHDEGTAGSLGLTGAPIEGPTHFSQFDPLAHLVWGKQWFERGCISAHFQTMVVEGEGATARAVPRSGVRADITAQKEDGSPVLTGSITAGSDEPTALDERRGRLGDPGELFIVDQISVGDRSGPVTTSVDLTTPSGDLYPLLHAPVTTVDAAARTGDTLFIRATSRGVNIETGRPQVVTWMVAYRFEGRRIAEGWIATVPDVDWEE